MKRVKMNKHSETWSEMNARHKRERREQVLMFAQDYTQTHAAKILKVSLTALNNYIKRNQINWKIIRQGSKNYD